MFVGDTIVRMYNTSLRIIKLHEGFTFIDHLPCSGHKNS